MTDGALAPTLACVTALDLFFDAQRLSIEPNNGMNDFGVPGAVPFLYRSPAHSVDSAVLRRLVLATFPAGFWLIDGVQGQN